MKKMIKKLVRCLPLNYIDKKTIIKPKVIISRFCHINKSNIDSYTYIENRTRISHANIGKFCSIASNVKIGLGKHPVEYVSTSTITYLHNNHFGETWINQGNYPVFKEINIGSDVWIGEGAVIMGGVRVGNGAVIGAGAVVTKDVEPYSIVGGVPAKVIKYRFDQATIAQLEKIKWWEWDIDIIKLRINTFNNVQDFINLTQDCNLEIINN